MTGWLLRRLAQASVVVVLMTLIVFIGLHAIGNPIDILIGEDMNQQERLQAIHRLGLDQPLWRQYLAFVDGAVHGSLGRSFVYQDDAIRLILHRLPATMELAVAALLLAVVIGVPLGLYAGMKPEHPLAKALMAASIVGFSLPAFWVALMMIMVFSVQLGWLPMVYSQTETDPIRQLKQMAMPVFVLALFQAATLARFVRASMLDNLTQDYARTARAKGLREGTVVLRHVLRNALFPVVTLIALQLPQVFTGAVVTEQIFRVPGMGALLIKAIQDSDTPVVMGIVLLFSILVVLSTLIADALYGLLDPRVRFS